MLAASLGCVHVPSHAGVRTSAQTPAAAPTHSFTLVCWNIHKAKDRRFAAELSDFTANADVVLLQEATSPVIADAPARYRWWHADAFRFVRGGASAGVAVGATFAGGAAGHERAPAREPFVRTPKSAVWVELAWADGHSLLVVNVHAILLRPASALAAQLAPLEARIRDHDGPAILAGDFNTWSRRRRDVVSAVATRLGLTPVWGGSDAPRLDNVYVRGLDISDPRVLDSRASDHNALSVVLHGQSSGRP